MRKTSNPALESLFVLLAADPGRRLIQSGEYYALSGSRTEAGRVSADAARWLLSRGLLTKDEEGTLRATPEAAAWLKRRKNPALPFRMQHGNLEPSKGEDIGRDALVNLDESPVWTLARHRDRDSSAWLAEHAVTAAERLRRDFEIGQLQPRTTANWSASVNSGRRTQDGAAAANLTDMALAARLRFDHAMRAVGPELQGILVDVCCFLKGLEIVERERRWPARSAKLVLRIALESLARHYGLSESASGKAGSAGIRGWGADDYRPEIS